LGMVATYQLKDAVIIHESLKYRPDLIIDAVTPSDFSHYAPSPWPSLVDFFNSNRAASIAFAQEHPQGLAEPLETYRDELTRTAPSYPILHLHRIGRTIRAIIRQNALDTRHLLAPDAPPPPFDSAGRQTTYDCAKTQNDMDLWYRNWKDWNILAYLAQVRDATGVQVAIVNWPVAHEPVGACYNVRYTNEMFEDYNQWLREETRALGLPYLDLHDSLPADEFIDSLHLDADGNQKVAEKMAAFLMPLLEKDLHPEQRQASRP